jgi:CRP-like cAMP-binding protein
LHRFFLNSGVIEIYTKDGFKKKVKDHGAFFGEGALISRNGLRSASIRCLTPVHVIEVSREYFEKFLNNDYDLKLQLRKLNISRQQERANAMLEVQQCLKDRTVQRNELFFTEMDPGDELYLLEEGRVDITFKGLKVFSLSRHGDIFGEQSLMFKRPRTVSAQCKSDKCKVHVISSRDFHSIVDLHPTIRSSLQNLFNCREFQKAVCVMTNKPFPENEEDLRCAFDIVDRNHSGKLELENIRNAIKLLDPAYSEEDVLDILASLDLDESGEVSWPEFKRLFGIDVGC